MKKCDIIFNTAYSIDICLYRKFRNIDVRALCNETPWTMSGGRPSSIKRIDSCAAASLHIYVPEFFSEWRLIDEKTKKMDEP